MELYRPTREIVRLSRTVLYNNIKYARVRDYETEFNSFLPKLEQAAKANDSFPSLVFADWLEEHGLDAHANIIRLHHRNPNNKDYEYITENNKAGGIHFPFPLRDGMDFDSNLVSTYNKDTHTIEHRIATGPNGYIRFSTHLPSEQAKGLYHQLTEESGQIPERYSRRDNIKYASRSGLSAFTKPTNIEHTSRIPIDAPTRAQDFNSVVPYDLRKHESFVYNPEQHHIVLHPSSKWSKVGDPRHGAGNYSFAVDTPQGKYFVKDSTSDPTQIGKELGARHVIKSLVQGIEVPYVESFIHPHFGEALAGPWLRHDTLRSLYPGIDKKYDPNWRKFDPSNIAKLLATEWLIHATDRNMGNYGFTPRGKVVANDYGEAFTPTEMWGSNLVRKLDPIHENTLFQTAELANKINRKQEIDPKFIHKLYVHGVPLVSNTIEDILRPYVNEEEVNKAHDLLQQKRRILKELLLGGKKVRLMDLPIYEGGELVKPEGTH